MLYILAYDVRDDKRLKKISNLCLDYGVRLQYSVFAFDLDADGVENLLQEISRAIDPAGDRIILVPVCNSCRKSVRALGCADAQLFPVACIF
ncbi:MAG: CRISPR-associated endonuclease Cas2 [Victivallaceae bacterium]|nr:CRISPR-associated endonuclease Cas2 [Victivallaceae bacterium]